MALGGLTAASTNASAGAPAAPKKDNNLLTPRRTAPVRDYVATDTQWPLPLPMAGPRERCGRWVRTANRAPLDEVARPILQRFASPLPVAIQPAPDAMNDLG
jgi:hypothetical protein